MTPDSPASPRSRTQPATTPEAARYKAPALEKGLDILEALSLCPEGYTLNQLAKAVNHGVSQIFRMVVALHRRGYIELDEHDRYRLTLRMFRLAHRQPPVKRLTELALPLLHEMAQRTHQSCHLAVYEQGRVVVIAQVDSPERWSFGLKIGSTMGLTDTSSGHVLMAYKDEIERTRMLNNHIKVEGELDMDPGQLFSLLADVRRNGHSLMPSIQIQGVTNIAFPVWSSGGQVIAALNVPHIARIDGAPCPSINDVKNIQTDICGRLGKLLGVDGQTETA